ncbi:hypothetical protein BN1221_02316 [Brenneria goodwinii]|uniref:Uncharacterized protein n=1 Tax=Brenneria goodwinii TaxID=1109412 RepID=A0A0G4JV83_9GAMM|nr:hypothetical protein BN1221_02316 [Brenneria goodwinii]
MPRLKIFRVKFLELLTAHFWYLISLFLIFYIVNMAMGLFGNIFCQKFCVRR